MELNCCSGSDYWWVYSILIVIAAAILGIFVYGVLKDKLPH